ncbi:MAG: hypothetical protein ACRDZR_07670 [Acidimicrobiales bacterium]
MEPVTGLLWDDFNREHIARHGVSTGDVEDVAIGPGRVVVVISHEHRPGRRELYGVTRAGRPVVVVTEGPPAAGLAYVVTTRPMTAKEWRAVEEAMRDDEN